MATLRETKKAMLLRYGKNGKITGDYARSLAVRCENGTFVGERDGGVIAYRGIPYAKPPVGERRWKRPEPVTADDGIYEASYFGPTPIQTEIASERASLYVQSEDCLYLNIWVNAQGKAPAKATSGARPESAAEAAGLAGKPVLVFIHGGSYGWGGTSDPLYDGKNLITKFGDIILVTIEYRTGIMGFIDFSFVPGGEEFKDSGNLGLLDQIEALRWIKKNIASFGGDPNNVTIAGESAGGGSVSLLPLIDEAKGLFNKIIAESGSIALSYSRDEVHDFTVKLMDSAKARDMSDLMALTEDELMELNKPLNEMNNFPLRDGRILPEDLYAEYENGAATDIKMLSGTNSDEARYWINEVGGLLQYTVSLPILFENNMKRVSQEDRKLIDEFLEHREKIDDWKLTEFYTEIMFRIPAILQAEYHAKAGGENYLYYWNYPSAIKNMGACHAVELAYVFNNLDETIYTGDNINFELADKVQQMWVNFVRYGNPSTEKLEWPAYNDEQRPTMILGSHTRVAEDPLKEQRKLLTPIIKYRFNGCYANLDLNVPFFKKLMAQLGVVVAIIIGIIAGVLAYFL